MAKGAGAGGRGGRAGGGVSASSVRNQLEAEVNKYIEEYGLPELTGGVTYGATDADHIMAVVNEPGTAVWGLRVNKNFIDSVNIENWVKQNHKTGWIVSRNLNELITHEAGHYLYRRGLSYVPKQAVASAYKTSRNMGFKGISRIGEISASEFFSETLVLAKTGRLRSSLDRRTFQELQPVFSDLGIKV